MALHSEPVSTLQESSAYSPIANSPIGGSPSNPPPKSSAPIQAALIGLVPLTLGIASELSGFSLGGAAGPLGAIGVSLIVGLIPRPFLDQVAPKPSLPEGMDAKLWERLLGKTDGGFWVGTGERLLILACSWIQAPTVIAAWLAFKLASKWEVWKNVVRIPDEIAGTGAGPWLEARHELGSWLLNRFWIGTIFNVLAGLLSAYIGSAIGAIHAL